MEKIQHEEAEVKGKNPLSSQEGGQKEADGVNLTASFTSTTGGSGQGTPEASFCLCDCGRHVDAFALAPSASETDDLDISLERLVDEEAEKAAFRDNCKRVKELSEQEADKTRLNAPGGFPDASIDASGGLSDASNASDDAPVSLLASSDVNVRAFRKKQKRIPLTVERVMDALRDCGTLWFLWLHIVCGARIPIANYCGLVYCSVCRGRWEVKVKKRLKELLNSWKWVSHLVLTIPNVPLGKLDDARKLLQSAFCELRRHKLWKNVKNWEKFIGLTVSKKSGEWHLHLHVALNCKWIDFELLREDWGKLLAAKNVHVSIKRVYDKTGFVNELIKGTKGDWARLDKVFAADPRYLAEHIRVFASRKRFSGSQGLPEEASVPLVCPRCGSPFYWSEWTRELLTDEEYRRHKFGACWADYFPKWKVKEVG